jgi:NAD-dependent dihydropyrimidine dehydrogenase PreA subunit
MKLRYLEGVTTLQFDPSKCRGCGRCVEVCPHAVFALEEGLAVLKDKDACIECGACKKNCAFDAITVKAGVGCAAAVLGTWTGGKKKKDNGSTPCCG